MRGQMQDFNLWHVIITSAVGIAGAVAGGFSMAMRSGRWMGEIRTALIELKDRMERMENRLDKHLDKE